MKTKEERLTEVLEIRKKFNTLQLSSEFPEIKELFDILSEFVNDGKYKFGCIRGESIQKKIIYHLKEKEGRVSEVFLKRMN